MHGLEKASWLAQASIPVVVHSADVRASCQVAQDSDVVRCRLLCGRCRIGFCRKYKVSTAFLVVR